MDFRRARKDDCAAGLFIQPVNHPHPLVLRLEQIDQARRAFVIPLGQGGQARRFIHDEEMFITEEDGEIECHRASGGEVSFTTKPNTLTTCTACVGSMMAPFNSAAPACIPLMIDP